MYLLNINRACSHSNYRDFLYQSFLVMALCHSLFLYKEENRSRFLLKNVHIEETRLSNPCPSVNQWPSYCFRPLFKNLTVPMY